MYHVHAHKRETALPEGTVKPPQITVLLSIYIQHQTHTQKKAWFIYLNIYTKLETPSTILHFNCIHMERKRGHYLMFSISLQHLKVKKKKNDNNDLIHLYRKRSSGFGLLVPPGWVCPSGL